MSGHRLPGVVPRRRFGHPHYELLACGLTGHVLVGADAADLRRQDAIYARELEGVRWHRCLRCDSWLPLSRPDSPGHPHPPEREALELPLRGRLLRDKVVLRVIAVDRAVHFVVLALLAAAIFLIAGNQTSLRSGFYRVLSDLQGPAAASVTRPGGTLGRINDLLSLHASALNTVGMVLVAYALLEGAEAVGLWYQRRWAEYLTFVATAALLPLEVYELSHRVSVFKVIAIVVNVAVVVYLLAAKRLFGVRGGAGAEQREREADLGWPAIEAATPAPLLAAARERAAQPTGPDARTPTPGPAGR